MNSRTIIIAVIVVLVIALCVGLYFLFFTSKAAPAKTATGTTGTLPATGTQSNPTSTQGSLSSGVNPPLGTNFGVISSEPTLDYFVNSGNVVTAIEPNGEIIQVASGQVTTINSLAVQNIINASFSYDGAKILVNFGDPADPQTSVFDIASQTWTPMGVGWHSPVWSPNSYLIAYYTQNTDGTESFATINASSSKPLPTALITLHAQDLTLAWPNKNELILSTKPSAEVTGSALLLNPQSRALVPIISEVAGLEVAWSGAQISTPEGLAFSVGSSNFGGDLQLVDLSGNVLQNLKFLTLPTKCAFSSTTSTVASAATSSPSGTTTSTPYLFCGVPRDQSTLSVTQLPDAYNEMAYFTTDDIYRINLTSGEIDTVFADQTQNLDLSDVKLFNNTLFFVNRYDEKLYAISLSA